MSDSGKLVFRRRRAPTLNELRFCRDCVVKAVHFRHEDLN